ncbi:protein mono-ADP-ribosyltransferase PARP14-like [Polypterus senegalus]|uniref:protein mono-ADP-ribosyltransferase PARP14-like n=1 Tax=Polypterus senegalus TaxID=55291 RepID=UPI0019658DCC|nr:protein mono-ADP-ribosyltransferase PARP14-like [Polypterus senegalus]
MAEEYPYRLIVEGNWSQAAGKIIKNKLQIYFQSKKKSNGGDCDVEYDDKASTRAIVGFRNPEIRKQVLEKTSHELSVDNETVKLKVTLPEQAESKGLLPNEESEKLKEVTGEESSEPQCALALVENIHDKISKDVLIMMVENISSLAEGEDFTVELISEINKAVVSFRDGRGILHFLEKCRTHGRFCQNKLTAKHLGPTKSIIVEDLPTNISEDMICLYFERPQIGGGQVEKVTLLVEEQSAIVDFLDHKVAESVKEKTHVIQKTTVKVYLYYYCLGTALYGKDRPQWKMPDAFIKNIDEHVFKFLQRNASHIDLISKEMSDHFCGIDFSNPAVNITPSTLLQNHKQAKDVKSWEKEASDAFLKIMSHYKSFKNHVDHSAWNIAKEKVINVLPTSVMLLPELDKDMVILAGVAENVDQIQEIMVSAIAEATRIIEREKNSVTEKVGMTTPQYHLLKCDGFEERSTMQYPDLKLNFMPKEKCLNICGLSTEVYATKSQVLEKMIILKKKAIELDMFIVQYLTMADNNLLFHKMFTSKGINAAYEISQGVLNLVSSDEVALSAAERQVRNTLGVRNTSADDYNVTQKQECIQLMDGLCRELNSENVTVSIQVHEKQLIIAGENKSVEQVYEKLYDFINRNTHIQENIAVKSSAIVDFIKMRKADTWRKSINLQEVNIEFDVRMRRPSISLAGPKFYVLDAKKVLQNLIQNIYLECLTIKKAGAKKCFQKEEKLYYSTVLRDYNCVIMLQEKEAFLDEDDDITQPQVEVCLPSGVMIAVCKADICSLPVDAVVNASNEDLQHIGGLAGALLKAAGPELQTMCDQHLMGEKLNPGDAVITKAGKLPCKYVIHAVGPRWSMFSNPEKAIFLLQKAVKTCLNIAENRHLKSIAIPAISSGIFGFPLDLCAKTIVKAVQEQCEMLAEDRTLKKIYLVNNDDKTVTAMSTALQNRNPKKIVRATPRVSNSEKRVSGKAPVGENLESMQTKEGLMISLIKGNIEEAATDIIVNSIDTDLELSKGAVSQAILKAAGSKLQTLIQKEASSNLKTGDIVKTEACALSCRLVFHAISPYWNKGQNNSEEILQKLIKTCLTEAENEQCSSVTLPAIGTGNLGFPRPLVASIMIKEAIRFSRSGKSMHLRDVHFIVHSSDSQSIQAFTTEFKNSQHLVNKPTVKQSGTPPKGNAGFIGHVFLPNLGVYQMTIGAINLEVLTGDITKETTDAIVNSSNDDFTLKSGVSKAILDQAGPMVERECQMLARQRQNGLIITKSGNLKCTCIIHLAGQKDASGIKEMVKQSLQQCEHLKLSSVSFPALGTGQAGIDPSLVANAMIDSIVEFASKSNVQFLKKIRIVIFQTTMGEVFYESMKAKEGTALPSQESWFTKLISPYFRGTPKTQKKEEFVIVGEIDPAIFHIAGDSSNAVTSAKTWIRNLIIKEQTEKNIKDELIYHFTEKEHEKLRNLQENLQVSVKIECTKSEAHIQVEGLTRDVLTVYGEIQEMIRSIRDAETQKREAEMYKNVVDWQYESNGTFLSFDSISNCKLEKGLNEDVHEVQVDINHKKYYVILAEKIGISADSGKVKVKRVQTTTGTVPIHWDDMKGTSMLRVVLLPHLQEYKDVEVLFQKTCKNQILKIERIQNIHLWKSYEIRKESLKLKNQTINHERQLFHGLAEGSVDHINNHGFNRSYAGKNAAVYGKGTYFAVDASYSASNTYSVPNLQGNKHMYLSRVLTGEFTLGNASYIVPPSKNTANPTDLYDSVVDNVQSPKVFVIFNDAQAYPEYLITFC